MDVELYEAMVRRGIIKPMDNDDSRLFLENGQVIRRWRAWPGQIVWVVRCSNYEPAEIQGIYADEDTANAECARLGDSMFKVEYWRVGSDEQINAADK